MSSRREWFGVGALVGLLAAGVAVGVGETVAAFVRPAASPIIVVGNRFILLTPESVRNWAIRHFGVNDKGILLTGIYVFIAIFAVVVGVLAVRRLWYGLVGMAVFGAIGFYCALTTHAHRGSDVVPTIFATLAGMAVLTVLTRSLNPVKAVPPLPPKSNPKPGAKPKKPPKPRPLIADRRQFIQGSVATGAVAVATTVGGRALQHTRFNASAARAAVALPKPVSPAPALANGTDLGKSGVPWLTPVGTFYRVDTALTVPQINPDKWSVRIHGMVDHEMTLTYKDILAMPLIERWITLTCVSNVVGGDLIGNARFLGARFADVLRQAGVQSGSDQLVMRSSDGMTIGAPTKVVMDGRDSLLAVGMDGEPLPIAHGFPVRVVVPGLYGYVSACKWVVDIEATTFSAYDAYWVDQGWIQQAPIQVSSRIDRPSGSQSFAVGSTVTIAGVAWQQHVGIAKVEVQIDDGAWTEARLAPVPSIDTWRQWVLPWTVTSAGTHRLRVRATDTKGTTQLGTDADPFPGAASGWHTVTISAHA